MNPEVFEPFRFADMHEEDGNSQKHQLTSATTEYFPFGLGRHAWYNLFSSVKT